MIAMVHFGALPGSPLYDAERGIGGLIDGVSKDIDALQEAGFDVSVVGDMTMPALGKGDVFLVTSGPGETSTVLALMKVAKKAGAKNLLLTAEPQSSAARLAAFMLLYPRANHGQRPGRQGHIGNADGVGR